MTQQRVVPALERFAATGYGDMKRLQGRVGEFRLRVGKWRVFLELTGTDTVLVTGIDTRGQAY